MSDAVSREAALLPVESMVLTMALSRLERGDDIEPNTAAFLAVALERLRDALAALPPVSPLGIDREGLHALIARLQDSWSPVPGVCGYSGSERDSMYLGAMALADAILALTDSQNPTVTVTDSLPPEASAEDANHPTTRQHSLHGEPAPQFYTERSCFGCGAAFWTATLESGVRGVWREGTWYCSIECADTAS